MNEIIKKYLSIGLSIIPVGPDKRPVPGLRWLPYKDAPATQEQAAAWELPIACICGVVSGGLVCVDFDNRGSEMKAWSDQVRALDEKALSKVLCQQTPSGGYHVIYRTAKIIKNKKLAQRSARDGELDKNGDQAKTIGLIETRGEGGYFLIAPSPGYKLLRGDFADIPVLSEDESDLLISVARSLNQIAPEIIAPRSVSLPIARAGLSPFDDYDQRNTPIELLIKNGWRIVSESNGRIALCRPGKTTGISATWNYIPNRFYVFSSATNFETEHIYKASAVYSILEHGGDFVQAAKYLYNTGYGNRTTQKQVINYDTVPATQLVKMSDYRDDIYKFYTSPPARGFFLGLQQFDQLLRFDHGYLNIISGVPTMGKSEFTDFIIMLLARKHNWNFVVFSPENYPLQLHFNKLAEKYHEIDMYKAEKHMIEEAIEFIDDHFRFLNATEDDLTLETIITSTIEEAKLRRVDCLVIDPWNEVELSRPDGMHESDFIGACLRKLRKIARKNNLCIIVIVHPTKMYRAKTTGAYPIPTLYDAQGSANWYNKSDNGIIVHRDFNKNIVEIYVKKVKFKNYGKQGMVAFRYDTSNGMYTEISENENKEQKIEKEVWHGVE
jgi:hypothetical protein